MRAIKPNATKNRWTNSLSRKNFCALTHLNTQKPLAHLCLALIRLIYLLDSFLPFPAVPDHPLAHALPPKNTTEQKKNQKNTCKRTYLLKG